MNTRIVSASKLLFSLSLVATAALAQAQNTNPVTGRLFHGTGSDPSYWSFVIPLDGQSGTSNAPANAVATMLPNLLTGAATNLYHVNATSTYAPTTLAGRFIITNAAAAFGNKYGGSYLYCGQPTNLACMRETPIQIPATATTPMRS